MSELLLTTNNLNDLNLIGRNYYQAAANYANNISYPLAHAEFQTNIRATLGNTRLIMGSTAQVVEKPAGPNRRNATFIYIDPTELDSVTHQIRASRYYNNYLDNAGYHLSFMGDTDLIDHLAQFNAAVILLSQATTLFFPKQIRNQLPHGWIDHAAENRPTRYAAYHLRAQKHNPNLPPLVIPQEFLTQQIGLKYMINRMKNSVFFISFAQSGKAALESLKARRGPER